MDGGTLGEFSSPCVPPAFPEGPAISIGEGVGSRTGSGIPGGGLTGVRGSGGGGDTSLSVVVAGAGGGGVSSLSVVVAGTAGVLRLPLRRRRRLAGFYAGTGVGVGRQLQFTSRVTVLRPWWILNNGVRFTPSGITGDSMSKIGPRAAIIFMLTGQRKNGNVTSIRIRYKFILISPVVSHN